MAQLHETHTTPTGRRLAIVSSASKMPSTCWGRYRHAALVEVADGHEATEIVMISERANAINAIIEETRDLHAGGTPRSAFSKALVELRDLMAKES